MLIYMIGLFGANRIAHSSGGAFPLGEHHPEKVVEEMQFDEETTANLLASSAFE